MSAEPIRLRGRGRRLGGDPAPVDATPADVVLEADGLNIALDGALPLRASYRDISTVAIQSATVLLVLGEGPGSARLLLEGFGEHLGQLVRELRERRLRQRLTDRFVDAPADPFELVEYASGEERGVAHLVFHPWGVVLAPLDERHSWRVVRRAAIERVSGDATTGTLRVGVSGGEQLELPGLGAAVERHARRWQALRDSAHADASAILAALVPDLAFGTRDLAARSLVDGSPASAADLGDAWPELEAAVLGEPTYAATYRALRDRGGQGGRTWLALAPERPGAPDRPRAWFFVLLPGNLLAMELVTEGAHATYCFRVVARPAFAGQRPADLWAEAAVAVRDISEALIDARFLREPMALPAERLREPRHLRYRLALRELPSLRAARARFVARLVHRDAEGWAAALDDLIAWHGGARDDDATWPGQAAQEDAVSEAAAGSEHGSGETGGAPEGTSDVVRNVATAAPSFPSGTSSGVRAVQ